MSASAHPVFESSMAVLDHATTHSLYSKLLLQLQKDLHRANLDLEIQTDIAPEGLKEKLQGFIRSLLNQHYEQLFHFLYLVDVSEKDMLRITEEPTADLSELCALLVLKRTWQKVWYRSL
ncbi:MAG: hypothetical protein OIF50_17625 [Flavobacteriaceae bacterium]|nr:hypothetical protein [Flavobacteriaceae bacterium]